MQMRFTGNGESALRWCSSPPEEKTRVSRPSAASFLRGFTASVQFRGEGGEDLAYPRERGIGEDVMGMKARERDLNAFHTVSQFILDN